MNTTAHVNVHPDTAQVTRFPVTVRVGLFFDGTGNNRVNSGIAAHCREQMQAGQQEHTRECAGRHAGSHGSYTNDYSNIARLFELYRKQAVARRETDGWKVYWPVYIGGVGTTSGGRDSRWPGQSLGRGSTGVLAKVDKAVSRLAECLALFALDNPGCVIDVLELDIFGFSRGAASARHLVNEILKQERGALGRLLADTALAWSPTFGWQQGSVRIMLVGLFDTVAAVGGWRDLGNVRDSHNRRVNLYLPPGCARQVLHLVARDEWRRNFALNSIAPGWEREIVLPGAHSDIGGGYHQLTYEEVLMSRPHTSVVGRDVRDEDSPAWREAEADLQAMDAAYWVDPADPHACLQVQSSTVASARHAAGSGGRLVMATVCMRRQVCGHLSRIHLRIMHTLACDEGVPFEAIGDSPDLALPQALEDICRRLIGQARGDTVGLTPEQQQLLRWRYIHHSAHWEPLIGTLGGLGDALFVHAPQPGGRKIHPNVAPSDYPY
ncbi:DUF2235 domain-containing protein [Pseudomonas sp. 21LCFQ010]|uniref:T6SS phospholipase effector Tle1-like catalytic domain-containing protein n=1 Tax=Pseudomonas sp. 21LCFQ010 TaxID=2957506 RepID=UPI0020972536|nr:DUF2235 domain-containing protein [Pseudomonas sp. 21LCFQ010]MCO8160671.1 DUF2235 domain-containing protein [Pseudomonas sp. 21LCFQ010]